MSSEIILASGSTIRRKLLKNAGVDFRSITAKIDEEAIKSSFLAERASPRDIADGLAEFKARKVSQKETDALVIGCDQVLELRGELLSKPVTPRDAINQLRALSGQEHTLYSGAVIYQDGQPLWRYMGWVRLFMRQLDEAYIREYVDENWDDIHHCVGGYQIEAKGARLFSKIEGDYFTVLGMPLLEVLNYLVVKGAIKG